jgi:hypothetical protein
VKNLKNKVCICEFYEVFIQLSKKLDPRFNLCHLKMFGLLKNDLWIRHTGETTLKKTCHKLYSLGVKEIS